MRILSAEQRLFSRGKLKAKLHVTREKMQKPAQAGYLVSRPGAGFCIYVIESLYTECYPYNVSHGRRIATIVSLQSENTMCMYPSRIRTDG